MVTSHAVRWITVCLLVGAGFAFGSSAKAATSPIDKKYVELGGAGGFLGNPTTGEKVACKGGGPAGRMRTYEGGNIYWSDATGAHETHGAILTKYLGFAGPCGAFTGYPTSDEINGQVVGEKRSKFQKGTIYWTGGGGAHEVHGLIFKRYKKLGETAGFLGLPTTDDLANQSTQSKVTEFQNGHIYSSSANGAHAVHGAILTKYIAANTFGGPDGFPIGEEITLDNGLGLAQEFQRANIYSSGAVGTHEVRGKILKKYLAMGGVYTWGRPTTDRVSGQPNVGWTDFEGVPGNQLRIFEHGVEPNVEAHEINGAILSKFIELGGEPVFGPPLTNEKPGKCDTSARFNRFQRHAIVWSPSTTAHAIWNDNGGSGQKILSKWDALGGDCSVVGLPTSEVQSTGGGGSFAQFAKGSVNGTIVAGGFPFVEHEVHGPVFDRWVYFNRENGFLGFPKSDVKDGPGGGKFSHFENGSIYYKSSNGAVDVDGAHDTKYRSLGGPSGLLGYPKLPGTSAVSDGFLFGGSNGTISEFDKGSIVNNSWTAPAYMNGKIEDKWFGEDDTQHGKTGYPTGDPFPTGQGGVFQQFQNHTGIPEAPHGTYFILNPHKDPTVVYKVGGPVLECYIQGPPGTSGNDWDSPMGFPVADVFAADGGEYGYFERGPDGRGGVIGTIFKKTGDFCRYGSTGSG